MGSAASIRRSTARGGAGGPARAPIVQQPKLPKSLMLQVFSYFDPFEETAVARGVCRAWRILAPPALAVRGRDLKRRLGEDWGDQEQSDYIKPVEIGRPVLAIRSRADYWHDQGFGNEKGQVITRLIREGPAFGRRVVAETNAPFGVASHARTTPGGTLWGDSDVVRLALPGDKLEWRTILGGGGGHSLTLKRFRAVVVFK